MANPTRYHLTGKARALGYVSSFSGKLVLTPARALHRLAPNDAAASDAAMQAFRQARCEEFVLGNYELWETSGPPRRGVFRGVVRINWYLDKRNQVHYDEVYEEGDGDGFCNNQFASI